jgi:translation elongation factor P/translation initiation factor 5A
MISATDLRKGVTFELDGELYRVLEYQHSYIGRGSANVRVRLRNLKTGATIERNFGANEKFQDVRLQLRQVQYLYRDGDIYYFMDTETYEQPALSVETLRDEVDYLKEGMELSMSMYEETQRPARPSGPRWRPDWSFRSLFLSRRATPSEWIRALESTSQGCRKSSDARKPWPLKPQG